ncbi:hypothetical protein J7L67_09395, partial [bacterium]|nr:hypothetical protein [bacterium]
MKFFIKTAPALIVGLLTVICYFNSIHNGFVYDDSSYVVNNHQIRSFFYIPEYFTNLCSYQGTGHEGRFKVFRPLVTLSFAIDYYLYGLSPLGFHFTNIVLHFLSGILVYYLFLKLSGKVFTAMATALIFICHPSQVESVTWVSGRGNMLYAIF